MLKTYFYISCRAEVNGSMKKFDSSSKEFDRYPTEEEIEAYIDDMIKRDFIVYSTQVEKRYRKAE